MKRAAPALAIATLLFAQAGHAVTSPQRLRGTIEQVSASQMTLQTRDGKTVTLSISPDTKFAGLTRSSLDEVQPGDFIGTATKGPPNFMVALEVVVFPESMRGTGEGQYGWDSIPDTTQGGGASATSSTMTNGNIDTAKPVGGPASVNSTMTNGTVAGGGASGGARTITVSYTDPKTHQKGTSKILLPPTAPVVLVQPADASVAKEGAKAFVIAIGEPGHLTALRVLAGENGVTPPM
jgi:hypothetical protein